MAKIRGHRVIGSAGSDGEGGVSARRARPRRRVQLQVRAAAGAAARGGAGRHRRLLRQRRRRPPRGGARRAARTRAASRSAATISEYDADEPPPGPSNLFMAVAKNLTIRGFRGSSNVDLLPEMTREVGAWLREGRLRYRETIVDGLEHAPEALAGLMRGDNTGKTLVPDLEGHAVERERPRREQAAGALVVVQLDGEEERRERLAVACRPAGRDLRPSRRAATWRCDGAGRRGRAARGSRGTRRSRRRTPARRRRSPTGART